MTLTVLRFASVMLTAVAMAAGFAHLLELPNKIGLSREDYLKVQQIYRGWALLGIVVTGALVCTVVLTRQRRHLQGRLPSPTMSASDGVGIPAFQVGSRTSSRLPEGSRKYSSRPVKKPWARYVSSSIFTPRSWKSRTAFSHSCGERVKE